MSDEPVEIAPGITVSKDVSFGKPVIKGTRIHVTIILGQLAAGATHEELIREYGVTEEAIRNVLNYAYEVIDQETVRAS